MLQKVRLHLPLFWRMFPCIRDHFHLHKTLLLVLKLFCCLQDRVCFLPMQLRCLDFLVSVIPLPRTLHVQMNPNWLKCVNYNLKKKKKKVHSIHNNFNFNPFQFLLFFLFNILPYYSLFKFFIHQKSIRNTYSTGNIKDDNCGMSSSVVHWCQWMISFLSSSIPNLKFDGCVIQWNGLGQKCSF